MNQQHLAGVVALIGTAPVTITTKYGICTPDGNYSNAFVGVIAGVDDHEIYLHTACARTFSINIDIIAGITRCLVPPPDAAMISNISVESLQAELDAIKAAQAPDDDEQPSEQAESQQPFELAAFLTGAAIHLERRRELETASAIDEDEAQELAQLHTITTNNQRFINDLLSGLRATCDEQLATWEGRETTAVEDQEAKQTAHEIHLIEAWLAANT